MHVRLTRLKIPKIVCMWLVYKGDLCLVFQQFFFLLSGPFSFYLECMSCIPHISGVLLLKLIPFGVWFLCAATGICQVAWDLKVRWLSRLKGQLPFATECTYFQQLIFCKEAMFGRICLNFSCGCEHRKWKWTALLVPIHEKCLKRSAR